MPVNFGYRLPISNKHELQFLAGPYLSYFIVGKSDGKADITLDGKSKTLTYFSDLSGGKQPISSVRSGWVNPIDFGLNVVVNFSFNRQINCGINYSLDLSNVIPEFEESLKGYNRDKDVQLMNSVISSRVGYSFGKVTPSTATP
jgi:hypothetical protein